MATATPEATPHQTVINHEPWCSDHRYDVGSDDEGHDVITGWCEADLEAASYTVTLTTGTNERGPRICVEHGREEFLTPAEAEELARVILRMVAAARAAANGG